MKKLLVGCFVVLVSAQLVAQEEAKRYELGLVFEDFDSYGLTFRVGNEHALWRVNTLLASGIDIKQTNNTGNVTTDQSSSAFDIRIGREFRKHLSNKMDLRIGMDALYRRSRSENILDDQSAQDDDRYSRAVSAQIGLGAVIGFNYHLFDDIWLGAEILPSFAYQSQVQTSGGNFGESKSTFQGFNYGLDNTSAMLSMVYQF